MLSSVALILGLSSAPALAKPGGRGQQADQEKTASAAADGSVKVLVFHGPAGKQNDPVQRATNVIKQLGADNGFAVDVSTDPSVFTAANLNKYRGVVFLSAKGVSLDADQQKAFQAYIKEGNGFVGVHGAAKAQPKSDWFSGLIGSRPAGVGQKPEKVAKITASAENAPNETKENLLDGDSGTKWLTFETTGWIQMKLAEPVAVDHYSMTSANDFPGRDPQDWTLQGSKDGKNWTDLDSRSGQDFPDRFQTKTYQIDNTTAYQYYKLNITKNGGEPDTQLADLLLFKPKPDKPPKAPVQQATVDATARNNPADQGLPLTWKHKDRWLSWSPNPIGEVNTVAQVEEKTYDPGRNAMGAFHPVSWCRDYKGGRSFYTGMGGAKVSYDDPKFRGHLLGAVEWATGMVRGDCQATIASNYKVERITGENAPGKLDQHGEMYGMTIAPDGTVFYIGKAACASGPIPDWDNPKVGLGCGTIHQWDPDTKKVKHLTTLDVFGNRGSGGELVKNEEGLVGIALDPHFMDNGWIYVYWMPWDSVDKEKEVGKRTISRLTYDLDSQTIDKDSRVDLLQWNAQVHSCCHTGGEMAFDDQGNLYIGSGGNTSSQGSQGYSANNWTKQYKGIAFQDARRTSGNTNSLNGKIIRIHPLPISEGKQPKLGVGSTYTIPTDPNGPNLFPVDSEAVKKGLARPEIYVMGVRNMWRLKWDHVHDWLLAGWVGPDAYAPSQKLGPAKYETATVITSAGNQGWPYCMGNKQPYRNRSDKDASVLTNWYDCDNLKNTSPANTGLVDIPPARKNMIWFSPSGGGPVFPDRSGSDIPTYKQEDATYTEPYLKGGGQAVMVGPTYHRSQVDTDSGVAWPAYWDNKWIMGGKINAPNRLAVTLGQENVKTKSQPAFAESLRQIIPSGTGDKELDQWMDVAFGPDGALYVADYSNAFFSLDQDQKILRITYDGGPPTPTPEDVSARASQQGSPKSMLFSGTKAGGVAWTWQFGDGETSHKQNPTHTYAEFGTHQVKLTVTYADDQKATAKFKVDVGCDAPDGRSHVWFLDTDTGVANHEVGGGCSINDVIADERGWSSHRKFMDYIDDQARQLLNDDVINRRERAKLVRAAAESDVGKKGVNGYEYLFDGSAASLADWTHLGPGDFTLQPDGSIHSHGGMGLLTYSKKPFADYSLRLQFRDTAPDGHRANSGVFVRFPDLRGTPPDQRPECGTRGAAAHSEVWVAIYCGNEIQIFDGKNGDPQKTGSVYNFAPVDREHAGVTSKGTWNTYEIRIVGQHYTIIRNGKVINEFDNTPGKESSRQGDPPTDLRQFAKGLIGLQNHSNDDQTEFRNIRIRKLND